MPKSSVLFRAAAAALIGLSLSACGGGSASSGEPTPAPTPVPVVTPPAALAAAPDDLFARAPNPIVLASTADDAHSASGTIGRAGGSLLATGADGTRYRFSVPPNALPEDTLITMTPIASATGAPWSRALGVRFEPAGLQFYRHATLLIEPAAGFSIAVNEQVMMGATADGETFFALPDPSPTPSIRVLHFSDYWFAQMSPEQVAAARLRLPRLAELQIEHEIAAALAVARQRALLGEPNPDPNATLESALTGRLFKRYLDDVIKPRIASARFCVDYKQLLSYFLGIERQRQLLGIGALEGGGLNDVFTGKRFDPDLAELIRTTVPFGNLLQAAKYTCAREASERCVARGHLDLIQLSLATERQAQLLGGAEFGSEFERTYLKFAARTDACYRFTVQFDSTLTVGAFAGAVSATSSVTSRISDYRPFAGLLDGADLTSLVSMPASAPLVNSEFDVTPPSCGNVSNLARGGSALSATLDFQIGANNRPKQALMKLTLGDTGEAWSVTGCGVGSLRYGPQPVWTDAFMRAHDAEKFVETGLRRGVNLKFVQADLPLNGGTTLLDKSWAQTVGDVEERSSLKVSHAPVPLNEPPLPPPPSN